MTTAKSSPTASCPGECGCGCIIGSDDFSANDGNPHAGWTNRPAIYSTAGGDEATNTGGVFHFGKPNFQKFNTANPEGASSPTAVYTKFKLHETVTGDGVSFIVALGYLDDDTFLYALVEKLNDSASCVINGGAGSGQITLYKRVAGVSTVLKLPSGIDAYGRIKDLTLDAWHEIWVCLVPNNYGTYGDGDTLRARVILNGVTNHNPGVQGIAESFTGGAYAGLGNRPVTVSTYGEVEFDDFKYEYFRGTSHLSCPNCNGPCLIHTDAFAYSDTDIDAFGNINCLWAATDADGTAHGVARFKSGQLEVESGGRVILRMPHPTNKSAKIVTVSIKWETGIVARVDMGSGYAQFDSTNRRIFLRDNSGTLLSSTAVNSLPAHDDAMHEVEVCLEDGVITATGFGECIDAGITDTSDPFVYLGSDGGTVHFDDFTYKKHKDTAEPKDSSCDECECQVDCPDACVDDIAPGLFKAVMPADIVNGTTGACANCSVVSGTHILEVGCPWLWDEDVDGCHRTLTLKFYPPALNGAVTSAGTYRIELFMTAFTLFGSGITYWALDLGANQINCFNLADLEIPWHSETGNDVCVTPGHLSAFITSL